MGHGHCARKFPVGEKFLGDRGRLGGTQQLSRRVDRDHQLTAEPSLGNRRRYHAARENAFYYILRYYDESGSIDSHKAVAILRVNPGSLLFPIVGLDEPLLWIRRLLDCG